MVFWVLLLCALPSLASLSPLRADLFFTPPIAANATLPDGSVGFWQPTVVTLVSGQSEAVLIDTLFTSDQAVALSDWIEETLTGRDYALYTSLTDMETIFSMGRTCRGVFQASKSCFPGQIPEESFQVLAKPLAHNNFTLEGHIFEAIDVGHSDTDETTFLHVPSLDMVVAGDIVYNDVHMWMTESTTQGQRDAWIRSLDEVAAVNPGIVVGSHHRQGGVDGAFNIDASKEYISTFSRLVTEAKNATDLYNKVLEAYPNRIGNLVLWLGCQAQFD
ncbi:beta-lactamase-like protein [Mycena rosella]|uniref:Beta-lactamase-like protein n=1 Tax=Mycena rosella TaxID=1033263 RepID=A0AAD7CPL5_MYCRO|nr:beta-lactamase-like protein [Mycena rosella]